MKISNYARKFFPMLTIILVVGAIEVLAFQINPQGNPFGTRGDTAIGGFLSNVLTILNAVTFYGGVAAALTVGISILFGWDYMTKIIAAVVGLGGWTIIGAIAYGLGNGQAFQIPGIT